MFKKIFFTILFLFFSVNLIYAGPNTFISQWNTSEVSVGSSLSNQISLPLVNTGSYDFNITWGDGNTSTVTSWDSVNKTHNYSTEGVYTLQIDGEIDGFMFNSTGDRLKLYNIEQWGNLRVGNQGMSFWGASNFDSNATDILNLTGITNLDYMFFDASSFNGNISNWDVGHVTSMTGMFRSASSFNGNISNWDVSSVTSMFRMFSEASSFNRNISNWNVSSITSISQMFYLASSFNQSLNNWDISYITNLQQMFAYASSFNQPLDSWNVSSVTLMDQMFIGASSFNQPLDSWDVSSVTSMTNMFNGASSFNQPLDSWDVSSVTLMVNMFAYASSFNQSLINWDVSYVTNMDRMFRSTSSFNQNLSTWCVVNIGSEPYQFALFSPLTLPPTWGSCNRAPEIYLDSPESQVYTNSSINLNISKTNKPVNTFWYSLNGGVNTTFTPNTTITSTIGINTITVFGNDSINRIGNKTVSWIYAPLNTNQEVNSLFPFGNMYIVSIILIFLFFIKENILIIFQRKS